MPSTATPLQSEQRRDSINLLRWQARTVADLLSAVHVLPAADQQTTLETASRLANEIAGDLAALAGGAA